MQFRRFRAIHVFLPGLAPLILAALATAVPAVGAASPQWEIQGEMSEACTCQVPCTCNFGQGPSPHRYCWSLASFHIEKGHYGKVQLDNLHLVRAHGNLSTVWYIDEQATPQQASALRALVTSARSPAVRRRLHFETALIVQTVSGGRFTLTIGNYGGFKADEIIGMDGKNPIVVENMTAWNVQHDIKGKASRLEYKDEFGNQFNLTNTNANRGRFDWTNETPNPF